MQKPPSDPSGPPPDSTITFHRLDNPAVLKVSQAKGIGSNLLEENKVQIISNGFHRLIFINGHRLAEVLEFDTPRVLGEAAGQVAVTFLATEIVERTVSREEWDRLSATVTSAPFTPRQEVRAD